MSYELRYVGPEPDCTSQTTLETDRDVFAHVAEHVAGDFEDCEMDFDDPIVQSIVKELSGDNYQKLIESVNEFWGSMNGDYYEVYTVSPPNVITESYEDRMTKVFASVEKARVAWQEWKTEEASPPIAADGE